MELNGKTAAQVQTLPVGPSKETKEETHGRICDSIRTVKSPVLVQSSGGNLNKCMSVQSLKCHRYFLVCCPGVLRVFTAARGNGSTTSVL